MNQKIWQFPYKWLLLAGWLLGGLGLQGQGILQKSRSISKAFSVNQNAPISLKGKYGTMHIQTWDKPSASIVIEVKVKGKEMRDIEQMLDKIDIRIAGDANGVSAEANIADAQQWNQNDQDISIKFKDGTHVKLKQVKINFNVYMPRKNPLNIQNKFGDIVLEDIEGNTDIWLKYGNLQAEHMGGTNKLFLGYGDANIAHFKSGEFETRYSQVDFEKVGTIRVNSKYSEINIESADSIIAGDKYNDYKIGNVGYLVLDEKHGDVAIRHIANGASVAMEYGDIELESLGNEFRRVSFDGEHTNVSIRVDSNTTYTLDAAAQNCKIYYPSSMSLSEHVSKPGYQKVVGKVGGTSKSVIYIRSDSGKVTIK